MKTIDLLKQLRSETLPALHKKLQEARKKALSSRFAIAVNKSSNHTEVSKFRREVARISTVINEKVRNVSTQSDSTDKPGSQL